MNQDLEIKAAAQDARILALETELEALKRKVSQLTRKLNGTRKTLKLGGAE